MSNKAVSGSALKRVDVGIYAGEIKRDWVMRELVDNELLE
jgi:hypothetical protein